MTQSVEVSILLLDSVIRTIEELMHAADQEAIEPDHQAVLDEVRELMVAPAAEDQQDAVQPEEAVDASEEEGSEPAVQSDEA